MIAIFGSSSFATFKIIFLRILDNSIARNKHAQNKKNEIMYFYMESLRYMPTPIKVWFIYPDANSMVDILIFRSLALSNGFMCECNEIFCESLLISNQFVLVPWFTDCYLLPIAKHVENFKKETRRYWGKARQEQPITTEDSKRKKAMRPCHTEDSKKEAPMSDVIFYCLMICCRD